MIEKLKKVYYCEFCKKKTLTPHSMKMHELKCSNNPENQRPCLNACIHLTKQEIEYDTGIEYYQTGDIYRKSSCFKCVKKNILMAHPKALLHERSENISTVWLDGEDDEIKQHEMPKVCEFYSNGFDFTDCDIDSLWD